MTTHEQTARSIASKFVDRCGLTVEGEVDLSRAIEAALSRARQDGMERAATVAEDCVWVPAQGADPERVIDVKLITKDWSKKVAAAIRKEAGDAATRTAPESCPHCFNEDDCANVPVCAAVEEAGQ